MDLQGQRRPRPSLIMQSTRRPEVQPQMQPKPEEGSFWSWNGLFSIAFKALVGLVIAAWLGLSAWGYWGPPGQARNARIAKAAAEREAAAPFKVVATDGPVTILRDKETGCEWIVATTTLREHRMTYRVDNLRPRSEVGPDGQVQQLCRPKSVQSPPALD